MVKQEFFEFFKTPFWFFSSKNFPELVKDEIDEIVKNKKSRSLNRGPVKIAGPKNMHTSIGGFTNSLGPNFYENPHTKIEKYIKENLKGLPVNTNITHAWINITSGTDYNRAHNHVGHADLVFVLYLTKGKLWIQNPNWRQNLDKRIYGTGSSISFDFKIGDMIVFPSDLYHWVEPYEGNNLRISVTGNLSLDSIIN